MNYTLQTWSTDERWTALVGEDELAESQAREYFWEKAEYRIHAEIDSLKRQGWEPTEEVGPDSIKLRKSQKIEFGVLPSDILLWFMTLGLAFIMHLLLNAPRRYVIYKPVQVRIRLSRLKQQELVKVT